MAYRRHTKESSSSRIIKPAVSFSRDVQLHVCKIPFTLDRELLTSRSAKLASLLKDHPQEDLPHLLQDMPADPNTFEIVARFVHGYDVSITSENVIRLSCLASYLQMTETHSPNNLLNKSLTFFKQVVLPSWNKTIRSLKSVENIDFFQQAVHMGLIDACIDSIVLKTLSNPRLLGEPIKNLMYAESGMDEDDDDSDNDTFWPHTKKKQLVLDWKNEDLAMLSIKLYEPIIRAMILREVPNDYIAASLYNYAKTRSFSGSSEERLIPHQRETLEAVERLLPHEKGLLPTSVLFEMLRFSITLEAGLNCKTGFEARIGKQFDQANVKDLLELFQGFSHEERYDTECLRKMLKHFYSNYRESSTKGIMAVANLVEDFISEIASDIDLKQSKFMVLLDMSVAASAGTQRNSDEIYRAIDTYLDKHSYLTENEKEEICRFLDCNKLSTTALEHAAQNQRLPLRKTVQVLCVNQLKLREDIVREGNSGYNLEGEDKLGVEMRNKVKELERECWCKVKKQKEKESLWKEMKRKFGCARILNECDCHVKKIKIHPK